MDETQILKLLNDKKIDFVFEYHEDSDGKMHHMSCLFTIKDKEELQFKKRILFTQIEKKQLFVH